MKTSTRLSCLPRRQHGVSLIAAVFIVVLLAGLMAAMVRVVIVEQATSGLDVAGTQAYQAARSGLEWGIYQQLRVQPPSVACFSSPQTFTMPANTSLSSFTVTVSCVAKFGNTVGDTTNRWTIAAVACNRPNIAATCPNTNPSGDYVARRVQAELN